MKSLLVFATLSAAALPLLADASLKSAALLMLAAAFSVGMRRSSAAARHVVWLAAVLTLLLVPVLSVLLPGWRVLPQWAVVAAPEEAKATKITQGTPMTGGVPVILPGPSPDREMPAAPAAAPAASFPSQASLPTNVPTAAAPAPEPTPPPFTHCWLFPLWLTGCALVLLRLAAAHFLLRRNTGRCQPAPVPLAAAFAAVAKECGLRRPVRLLLDNARTIPVVWGILRPTLLLPAEATTWDATQLRSVLLHEIAHLRRRDPLVQFLTQIACALHWFNPLVWLAAWRLHVERERACDDLVLASGVRPSTYAEHLLHIATQLSPARWTHACGLAMARKSSLEGRLLAVLSEKLNRRRLTRALTAAAILLSAAIAVPIAMLRAQTPTQPSKTPEKHSAKIDRPNLTGKWHGEKDGVKVSLDFLWLNEHQQVKWTVITRSGASTVAADMSVVIQPDGSAAELIFRKGQEHQATQGRLTPGEDGALRLEIIPNPNIPDQSYPAVKDIDVTLKPGEPAGKSTNLPAETEAQLDWGEPVNGLRGAIVIRPTAPGAEPGIFLAVQNVSDKLLHFADTTGAKDFRKLYVSDTKGILFALTSGEPTKTDATLQPREVAYLRLLDPVASGEKSVEPTMIEGLRKDSLQTWRAVLDIQNAPDGAWKGKLTTGETRGNVSLHGPQPKDPKAQALYKLWQNNARLNGDIPGGLVRLLHDKVKEFIRNNEPDASGGPYAKMMKPLEPRFGVAGDWKPGDVVALLDDVAAAHTIPLETSLEHLTQHMLQPGQPLPATYAKADWGTPLESGLRMAYMLEPQAATYHLGTEVKARMILHNSGKEPVAFVTHSFQQPGHKAKLAGGGELKLDSTYWTTLGRPAAYRLAPGEYCEIYTPGLGIGAQNQDRDDWASVRAGSWILCREGDEVIFSPGPALLSRKGEEPDHDDWWLEFITQRLERETPLPSDTKEREYLLYRVVRDLYGAAPSTTEGEAFAADKSPDALKNLAALLAKHPYGTRVHGSIRAGDITFKVLPPDPDAAKRVRVASSPGWYNLSDALKFSVTRRPQGNRIINEASIIHFQPGKDNAITKVELPDGYNTWAAAQEPGTTVLWIKQKDLTRRYDFTDPANIKETRSDGEVPDRILEAVKPIFATPEEAPAQKGDAPPPPTPVK